MSGQRPRRDHYAVLGVPCSASAGQITSAYRRMVRSLHPDARPEDPAAAEALADVLAAYDTLRDPGRRAAYDAGRTGPAPGTAGGRPVPVRVRRTSAADGPLFSVSVRFGPRRADLAGWDDLRFVARVVRQWLQRTDTWPR